MELYLKVLELYQHSVQYVIDHPIVLAFIVLILALASVGAWYVIAHHLEPLIITLLCVTGFGASFYIFYRGMLSDMNDIAGVGGFLMLMFLVIYVMAFRVARFARKAMPPIAKGHAKRAGI